MHATKSYIHKSSRATTWARAPHLGRNLAQTGHIDLVYISDRKYVILHAVVILMLSDMIDFATYPKIVPASTPTHYDDL